MRPGQLELNKLEQAILDRIAESEPVVRPMIKDLNVLGREYTGVGSFTHFLKHEAAEEAETKHHDLNELISVNTVSNGLGAALFCKGENADFLEIFTFGAEHWDGTYEDFEIGQR